MIREDEFVLSHRPYAIALDSLRIRDSYETCAGKSYWYCEVSAVWFRRRKGVLAACMGTLCDLQERPADIASFLAANDDGRYGGRCLGRWDGERYWGSQVPDVINFQHLPVLRAMLMNYPACPPGYDGWWRF